MSSVTLPPEIQQELDERRHTLTGIDDVIRQIEEETKRLTDEMDQKKEEYARRAASLAYEISLIERIAKAFEGQTKPLAVSSATDAILRALANANQPIKGKALSEATGLCLGTVGVTLHHLRRKKMVVHDREAHLWSLA